MAAFSSMPSSAHDVFLEVAKCKVCHVKQLPGRPLRQTEAQAPIKAFLSTPATEADDAGALSMTLCALSFIPEESIQMLSAQMLKCCRLFLALRNPHLAWQGSTSRVAAFSAQLWATDVVQIDPAGGARSVIASKLISGA